MKKLKLLQLWLVVFCLFVSKVGSAQTDYVVTIKGDTIRGSVKYLNSGLDKRVQLTPLNGKKIVYTVLQTAAFKLGADTYCPVRNAEGYVYMKLLKTGYLSLYAFQQPNQFTWDGRYLLKKDGQGIEVPNLGFKKTLNKFLVECLSVTARIMSGELTKTKIIEIIDQFNDCIDANTKKPAVTQQIEQPEKIIAWSALEKNINDLPAFEQKTNALEMIAEIKSKINKGEKIPNFLTEGLKEALKDQPSIKETLDNALAELKS